MNQLRGKWIYRAALLWAFGAGVYYFSYLTADPDLWGHITFGEDLIRGRALPQTDGYSFTAEGRRWINHEWLSEVVFYGIYDLLKGRGLLIGKALIGLVLIAVSVLISRLRTQNSLVLAFVMLITIAALSPGFMIRPQLFSFLFFSLFLYLFHLYFTKQINRLYLIPILMAMWVNLHGGFLTGWGLVAFATIWKTGEARFFNQSKGGLFSLWACFAATSSAVCLNPYGYHLIVFLVKTLSLPRPVSEWAPVAVGDFSHIGFKLSALLFLTIRPFKYAKERGWEFFFIAVTMAAGFYQRRHIPFSAIAAAPYLVFVLSDQLATATWIKRVKHGLLHYAVLGVLGVGACCFIYAGVGRYVAAGWRIVVDPFVYPVSAVEFIKTNRIKGNLLVPFEWGEYCIWKLYPDVKVSIDGRFRTVYPESVIQDHFIGHHDHSAWIRLINKYPSDVVLAEQNPFFHRLMRAGREWIYVYSDKTAMVFIRNSLKNNEMITRFKAGDFQHPITPPSFFFP